MSTEIYIWAILAGITSTVITYVLISNSRSILPWLYRTPEKESQKAEDLEAFNDATTRLNSLATKVGVPNSGILAAAHFHNDKYSVIRNEILKSVADVSLSRKFAIIACAVAYKESLEQAGTGMMSPIYVSGLQKDGIDDIFGDLVVGLVDLEHSERLEVAANMEHAGLTTLSDFIRVLDRNITERLRTIQAENIVAAKPPSADDKMRWN